MDEVKRHDDYCSGLEQCERIFVKLAMYWRTALIGFVALLTLGGGVWAWTWAEVQQSQNEQDDRIEQIEAAFNDIAYLRSQSNEILENQRIIIKYFERRK